MNGHKRNMSCASSVRREVGFRSGTCGVPVRFVDDHMKLDGQGARNVQPYSVRHRCETATCHQSVHRVRFGTYAPQSYATSHPLSAPRARHCHTHLTTSPLRAGALESLSTQQNLLKTPFKCIICFGSTLLSPRSIHRQISLELCDKFSRNRGKTN